jgi:hypothetical protein
MPTQPSCEIRAPAPYFKVYSSSQPLSVTAVTGLAVPAMPSARQLPSSSLESLLLLLAANRLMRARPVSHAARTVHRRGGEFARKAS